MALSQQDLAGVPVFRAYRAFLAAFTEGFLRAKDSATLDPDIERKKYLAALDALSAYYRPANWVGSKPIDPLPPEIAHFSENLIRRLLNKDRVPSFEVAQQCAERQSLDAKQSLSFLVLYVRAARGSGGAEKGSAACLLQQALDDRDPVETVRIAFGINAKQQVYEYLNDPDFAGVDPDRAFLDWPDIASRATMIRQGMEEAGKAWSVFKSAKAFNLAVKRREDPP